MKRVAGLQSAVYRNPVVNPKPSRLCKPRFGHGADRGDNEICNEIVAIGELGLIAVRLNGNTAQGLSSYNSHAGFFVPAGDEGCHRLRRRSPKNTRRRLRNCDLQAPLSGCRRKFQADKTPADYQQAFAAGKLAAQG
jgi:hypothetical protein